MDLGLSLQEDYSVIDGIDRVTVKDESTKAVASSVIAKRSNLSNKEMNANSGYDGTETVWRLWADTIPFQPRPGDTVKESTGEIWVVDSVTTSRIGKRIITYRCVCTKRGT